MRRKITALWAVAAVAMIAIGLAHAAEDEQGPRQPEVLAVLFHADWCGTCEQLKAPVKETAERLAEEPVLFVKLDLTDEKTRGQAEMLAAALGLDDVWNEHSRRTGFVLLVDRESGEALARLTTEHSSDDMAEVVGAALAHAGQ